MLPCCVRCFDVSYECWSGGCYRTTSRESVGCCPQDCLTLRRFAQSLTHALEQTVLDVRDVIVEVAVQPLDCLALVVEGGNQVPFHHSTLAEEVVILPVSLEQIEAPLHVDIPTDELHSWFTSRVISEMKLVLASSSSRMNLLPPTWTMYLSPLTSSSATVSVWPSFSRFSLSFIPCLQNLVVGWVALWVECVCYPFTDGTPYLTVLERVVASLALHPFGVVSVRLVVGDKLSTNRTYSILHFPAFVFRYSPARKASLLYVVKVFSCIWWSAKTLVLFALLTGGRVNNSTR